MKDIKRYEAEAYESFMDRLTDPIPPQKGTTVEAIRQMRIKHRKELVEAARRSEDKNK